MPGLIPESDTTRRPATPGGGLSDTPRSYGAIVWGQLRKRATAMVSLAIIAMLALVAVLAPFVAGDVPIRWVEGGRASWPIFRYLTNGEYVALLACLLVLLMPLTVRLVRRRATATGVSPIARALLVSAVALVAAAMALAAVRTPERAYGFYLERRDEADSAWFPVIPTARYPGYESLAHRTQPPSWQHPLGTDRLGGDVVMRLLYGARTAMTIGFVAVGIGVSIGVTLGSISGYFAGKVDLVMMRIAEIVMFIPQLVLIIMILAIIPSSFDQLWAVVLVIGVTGWTGSYRLMRAELMRIRGEDYILAARALGIPTWRLLLRHAVPNGLAPILVGATFGVAGAVFLETTLAFLSLVQTPSWGEMLNDGRQHLQEQWWLWSASGAAIFITVLVYNLLGEAIRDAIDPRLKV
jgi:peptide/nickel transport system permease protein